AGTDVATAGGHARRGPEAHWRVEVADAAAVERAAAREQRDLKLCRQLAPHRVEEGGGKERGAGQVGHLDEPGDGLARRQAPVGEKLTPYGRDPELHRRLR